MSSFHSSDYHVNWQRFLERFPVRSYTAGETILLAGEEPNYAYLIKKGVVKTYNITDDGAERPVTFDAAGEIFPIGWVFGRIAETHYFYQAFTDCQLLALPRNEFLEYLRQNFEMSYEMYAGLAARFVSLQARVYALEQPKAADKIINTLLYLGERFGKRKSSRTSTLTIPLTQQELANFVGLTRETTSSELKKLERLGVITYSHKKYALHTEKLAKLAR